MYLFMPVKHLNGQKKLSSLRDMSCFRHKIISRHKIHLQHPTYLELLFHENSSQLCYILKITWGN